MDVMDETKTRQMLAGLRQLPIMPAVVQEVIASFDQPAVDVPTLAKKIAEDGGLTTKVLRLANSAFYGVPGQVGSIEEAVMLLGFASIRSLVVAAALQHAFPATEGGMLDREGFWHRSIRMANCARVVAKRAKRNREMAFVAGLLCDVGLVVLDMLLPEKLAEAQARARSSGADLLQAEREASGVDHIAVGADAARQWNFPAPLQDAIRYGWPSDSAPGEPLADVVRVARGLMRMLEGGGEAGDAASGLSEAAAARLGLDGAAIEGCLSELAAPSQG